METDLSPPSQLSRRERRRRSRRLWTGVTSVLALVFVVGLWGLSNAAVTLVAPFVRTQLAPLIRDAAYLQEHPIREADVPRLLPGIPIFTGAQLDTNMTLLYSLMEHQGQASDQPGPPPVAFTSAATGHEVLAWYRRHLLPAGWSMEEASFDRWDDAHWMQYRRNDRVLVVRVSPQQSGFGNVHTVLVLRLSRNLSPRFQNNQPWPPNPNSPPPDVPSPVSPDIQPIMQDARS